MRLAGFLRVRLRTCVSGSVRRDTGRRTPPTTFCTLYVSSGKLRSVFVRTHCSILNRSLSMKGALFARKPLYKQLRIVVNPQIIEGRLIG